MKYPVGTKLKAKMSGSRLENDFVTATVIGYKDDEVHVQLIYSHIERQSSNRKAYYNESAIDKWLADDWVIIHSVPKIQLDEDLFQL